MTEEREPIADGVPAHVLFEEGLGLSYDDYILMPGFIDFHASQVSLETRVTRRITIKRPIVSAPWIPSPKRRWPSGSRCRVASASCTITTPRSKPRWSGA